MSDGGPCGAPPAANRRWAYFLDIDGTLAELAATPRDVRVPRATLDLVTALSASTGGAVALVSGRSIGDIDRMFPFAGLHVVGQHGSERRDARGERWMLDGVGRHLDAARARLAAEVAREPALLLEDKGRSIALHYRAAPRLEAIVLDLVERVLRGLGSDFAMQRGKYVVEIRPSGVHKGTAIEAILAGPPFARRVPVFIGDDVTDEMGFAVVNARGGHSVKVGDGPSVARWRLKDVSAVTKWLAAACVEEESGSSNGIRVRLNRCGA